MIHGPEKTRRPVVAGVYLGHDPCACLMENGVVRAFIEEERLNRFKHGRPRALGGLWKDFAGKFGYFPWASLSCCLREAGLELNDLDLLIVGDEQWAADARHTIKDVIPLLNSGKIVFADQPGGEAHHFHHALSSFYASDFQEAAVLVVDGDGNLTSEGYEAETGLLMNRNGAFRRIFKNRYQEKSPPRSGIGWMYEQVSYLLGYGNHHVGLAEPGKTMGLSSYGQACEEFSEPWIRADGFHLDFSGFKAWFRESGYDRLIFTGFPGLAAGESWPSRLACNLAWKVQHETEKALIHLATELQKATGAKALCLGGGVALNSVANGALLREKIFEKLYIMPATHDGGQAYGLALHGHLLLTNGDFQSGLKTASGKIPDFERQPVPPLSSAYTGPTYSETGIRTLLENCELSFRVLDQDQIIETAAGALASGSIIGWFQGRSEAGPRALGNRSILADPSGPLMKDRINSEVKFREGFRPFAPSVQEELCQKVFNLETASPYMLRVAMVRDEWKDKIPAVVHVDGTARIQTVTSRSNHLYYRLLQEFYRMTKIPVLLNTSFNLKGMPVVESPLDALSCFLMTGLDELYLGPFHLSSPVLSRERLAFKPGWKLFKAAHDTDTPLRLETPGGTCLNLSCDEGLYQKLSLLTKKKGPKALYSREESIPEGSDRTLKAMLRLGALELLMGNQKFSSSGHDKTWAQELYSI